MCALTCDEAHRRADDDGPLANSLDGRSRQASSDNVDGREAAEKTADRVGGHFEGTGDEVDLDSGRHDD